MMNFSLNGSRSFEPRLSFKYRINENAAFALAGGFHSQIVPIGSYFSAEKNMDLDLMKSRQIVGAYTNYFSRNYKLSIEGYFQKLDDIPVAVDSTIHYWMLNDLVGYSKYELKSEGQGRNYGVDITLERFFENRFFFLGSLSLYRSEYSLENGNYLSSRYDSNFGTSLMFGKELVTNTGNTIQLGFRNLLYGGQRYTPPDDEKTRHLREFYSDPGSEFTEELKTYWRSDIRIAFRKDLEMMAWSLSLDVQNIFNVNNAKAEIWNFATENYEFKSQTSIIPVLNYQIDF
jgi:hypothetical protein